MDTIKIKGANYLVESLSEQNLADLIPLYGAIFGVQYTLGELRKKYDTHYLGVTYFGHFARNEAGQAVAFHGAIPYAVTYKGKTELAAQYGDAMTLPDYTGRGFFTLLGNRTDEALKVAGIRFVYGFPNQNSEYGYLNKLGWQYKHRIHRYKIEVKVFPLEAICRRVQWMKSVYQRWVLGKLNELKSDRQSLANSADIEGRLSTRRDKAYFDYKSFTNNLICDLEGDLVWLKLDSGILVGDISLKSPGSPDKLLKNLRKLCRRLGVISITFQWYPGTEMDLLFKRLQQPAESWVVGYKNFNSEFPVQDLVLSYGDLDTF